MPSSVDHRLGVQIEGPASARVRFLTPRSFVVDHVYWMDIERQPGVYEWDTEFDADQSALRPWPRVLAIKSVPEWARAIPTARNCPLTPEAVPAFVAFVKAVVARYQPEAIELFNEPDVQVEYTLSDGTDRLRGGYGLLYADRYGQLVKAVCKALKSSGVKVIAGALAAESPEFWKIARKQLGWMARPYAISFHAYAQYPTLDFNVIAEKAAVLRKAGEQGRLWATETSYLYRSDMDAASKAHAEQRQAEYLRYVYLNMKRLGVERVAWYTLAGNGWRNSDLVEKGRPKAAWQVFRSFTQ